MNDRAVAQKRLNENSFDLEAMCMLNRAQEQVSWGLQQPLGELEGNQGFLSWQLVLLSCFCLETQLCTSVSKF